MVVEPGMRKGRLKRHENVCAFVSAILFILLWAQFP